MAVPDASGFRETVYACAGLYGVLFVVSTAQLLRSCHRYRAWTTQKVLHLLLLLGCACRASFLGCLASWWDRAAGALGPAAMSSPAAHEAFYALDELANLLFLAVFATLVLFWARVYCTSLDKAGIFTQAVTPLVRACLAAIVAGHGTFVALHATAWRRDGALVGRAYAVFCSTAALWLAAAQLYCGVRVYAELRGVPVELRVRMIKAREVGVLTAAWSGCYTARSLLMLWLANTRASALAGPGASACVLVYFALLEALPAIVVLYFHRRVPSSLEMLPADLLLHSPAGQGLLSRAELQALREEAAAATDDAGGG